MTGYRYDLKAGDIVLLWNYNSWEERKVKRVTKTQIVLGNDEYEVKYRKSDGRRVGDSYSRSSIRPVTEQELAEFRESKVKENELRQLRNDVQNAMRELPRYRNMSKEQCEILLNAVAKMKGE